MTERVQGEVDLKASFILAIAGCLLVFAFAGVAVSQSTDTFDSPPADWEFGPGTQVIDGVLSIEPGGLALRMGVLQDVEFTVRVRIDPTTVAAVMYQTGTQGDYAVWIMPGRVELVREGAQPTVLAGEAASIEPGQWVEVSVSAEGSDHVVTVAGTTLEATDPDPHLSGGIAFRAEGNGTIEIDDLTIGVQSGPSEAPPTVNELTWIRTGGPLGGLGYDVRMHPDDPDHLYVTDAFAGVFISEDGGDTWFPSNEGIITRVGASGDAIPVFSLTIDPHDPDIVWIGTQFTRGIFRSDDGGRTWVEKDDGIVETEGITFRGFTVDPQDSDTVYAAAELSSWTWAGEEKIGREFDRTAGAVYRTTDGGEQWQAIWRGDNLARYIWIAPDDPDTIYISTGIFDREAADSEPDTGIPGGEGVVKSTDGGATWTNATTGLDNLYVGSLFMHPTNPDILLAGAGNNQYFLGAGVYLTTNGGDSWTRTLSDDNITSVEFATSDPNVAYAGSAANIYRSGDGGQTWDRVSTPPNWGPPGIVGGFPIDFQVDPRDPNRLFANNYGGGNFLTTDGGRTWTAASDGYTGAQVRSLVVDPTEPGRVFAAARSGIFVSHDGGQRWEGLVDSGAEGLEWNTITLDPSEPQHVLTASNWNPVIIESRDRGQTWQSGNQSLPEGQGWREIAFAPSDPTIVYAGSAGFYSAGGFAPEIGAAGIWRSQDGGATWDTANDPGTADAHIAGLAIDPNDPRSVYAASPTHGLLVTTDGGASWNAIEGLPSMAYSVAVGPSDPSVVVAGFFGGGVYRSDDSGVSWTRSAAGLPPEAIVSAVVFDPSNPTVVYAGDELSGVYQSNDGGVSWQQTNNGLHTRAISSLSISADGAHLYAGTEGGGVFRLDLNGSPPATAAEAPTTDLPEDPPDPDEEEPVPAAGNSTTVPAAEPNSDAFPWLPGAIALGALGLLLTVGWVVVRRRR
ncbi:MAG: WD40/YVTN/BNR-like repeat-containing protein [Acidimicrobiia bacterium]